MTADGSMVGSAYGTSVWSIWTQSSMDCWALYTAPTHASSSDLAACSFVTSRPVSVSQSLTHPFEPTE